MSFAPGTPQSSPVAGPAQPVDGPMLGARYGGPGGTGSQGAPGAQRPGSPTALAGCVPAAPGRRAAAAFTDGLVMAAPAGVAASAAQVGLSKELPGLVIVGAVLGLAWLVGFVIVGLRFVQTGASPGKRAMGLRLVDLATGGAPGFRAWGRFGLAGLGAALAVGWVLAVVQVFVNKDGERRTWYDGMTGLVLLDVEAGRDPFFVLSGAPAAAPAPRSVYPSGDLSDDAPTWVGPSITSLAPGQHGTQFGQQHAGGGFAPPAPPAPPAPATPPASVDAPAALLAPPVPSAPSVPSVPSAPLPAAPIPVGVVHLPPIPPPPPPPPAPVPPAQDPAFASDAAAVAVEAAAFRAEPARAIFTFASGQVHEAAGAGVIGRAPRPSRTGEMPAADPGVLTVTDVTRTVSKAHLSFRVEASGVWLTDLGSTNGSTIIGRFGVPTVLVPGATVLAAYGSTVTVGELSFTLASVPAAPQESDDIERTIHRDRR